jgi:hypothetical protein
VTGRHCGLCREQPWLGEGCLGFPQEPVDGIQVRGLVRWFEIRLKQIDLILQGLWLELWRRRFSLDR